MLLASRRKVVVHAAAAITAKPLTAAFLDYPWQVLVISTVAVVALALTLRRDRRWVDGAAEDPSSWVRFGR